MGIELLDHVIIGDGITSVADGAYTPVNKDGGSNNIIFYVIIGVLAVAVVALAVLMIKKK